MIDEKELPKLSLKILLEDVCATIRKTGLDKIRTNKEVNCAVLDAFLQLKLAMGIVGKDDKLTSGLFILLTEILGE